MILKELIEWLEERDPNQVVLDGFGCPHSDRGNYEDLAFDPVKRTTYGEMLSNASRALGCTFGGWKGGEFKMDEYSKCRIGHVGECGEDITSAHLRLWQSGKCRTWTLCSEQLHENGWRGMIAIDGTLWPIARYLGGNLEDSGIHYQVDEPTYYYRWLRSVRVDPRDYDKCSWCDYPELPVGGGGRH